MPRILRKQKLFLFEVTKVLIIFAGFYFLQSQIFSVRYDVHGRTSGLAHAQEKTSSELDHTQRFLEMTMQDVEESHAKLLRTKQALDVSLDALRTERERLLLTIEGRTDDFERKLETQLQSGWQQVEAVRAVAESNASRLAVIGSSVPRTPEAMKRGMLYPTLQLRGNGTVGSGVLVYSEPQPEVADGSLYSTFALTAYHVVAEVMGDRLDGVLDEVHVLDVLDASRSHVHSARLILFDKARDVALLRLETASPISQLARLMPRSELDHIDVFSPAYAVGCPLGNRPLPTLGEVSSKSKVVGDQTFWMLNAPTFFGNSGGGIYSVPGCELVGVSSMIYTYGKSHPTVVPHMGLFVPLEAIYRWLDDEGYSFIYERKPIPARLRWKLAYAPGGRSAPVPASSSALESAAAPGKAPELRDSSADGTGL